MNDITEKDINYWKELCFNKKILHYKETDPFLYMALEKYSIEENEVLIVGSQEPCYEAVALWYMAKNVTVVEYQELKSTYDKIKVLTVPEFEKEDKMYDCCISISSIEHSGLGRYGDAIDENGDLKTMELLRKKIKVGGLLFLAVPIGADRIDTNGVVQLHRVYGKKRLPELLKNWNMLEHYGFEDKIFNSMTERNQPLFVLEKL